MDSSIDQHQFSEISKYRGSLNSNLTENNRISQNFTSMLRNSTLHLSKIKHYHLPNWRYKSSSYALTTEKLIASKALKYISKISNIFFVRTYAYLDKKKKAMTHLTTSHKSIIINNKSLNIRSMSQRRSFMTWACNVYWYTSSVTKVTNEIFQ